MTPEQIIATVALLAAGGPDPAFDALRAGGHDDRYPVTVSACPETTAPLDVEGRTIICGTVDVPETYDEPNGRRLSLAFALARSHSTQPFRDPVVYLHGGPAGGALGSIAGFTEVILGAERAHRDIVTFDQRAAMLSSSTVRCYEAMAENVVGLAGADPDFDPEALLAPCVRELYASGADLPQYNTANNARDVRALMSALGYPAYNIFGISYGSRLALEVLRTAPEGVRSVVIDGVAPPMVKLYDDLFPPHGDAMEAMFDQCAAQPACAEAYPDLRQDFIDLGVKLAEEPIPAARGKPAITADDFYAVLAQRTDYSALWTRDLTAYLPRIITELADGDPTTFDWYLETHEGVTGTETPSLPTGPGGLSDDERALARAVLESAESMLDQRQGVAAALTQLQHDVARDVIAVSLAETFDLRATDMLREMPKEKILIAIQDYALFQTREPTRATLRDWVAEHFAGSDREALLDMVAAMSEADIARTFEIADTDLTPLQQAVEGNLGLFIYACQEDFPYNSLDGARASMNAFPYTVIATETARAGLESLYDACALFEPAPRAGFHEPVASDVPVLSFGGTNDNQTSWKWSELAAETLPNARVVILPNSGHGSSLYTPCGNDMRAKFFLDPAAPLDTSCADGLVPEFVLPDAPLG